MTTISQRSFASGEISPSLYARVDLTKYATGLRTCKNGIVLRYGGVSNRPGTSFVGEVNDSSKAVRLIPFIFNTAQTYVLEFGEQYIRVIKDGQHLTEAGISISGITQANPAVVTTSASHGYSNGDEVYINGISGMTQVNNRNFKIANITATTFELQEMDGTNLDSTSYDAYISGGDSYKMYEISSPYLESELATIKYVQSADVVTLAHPNHPPAELTRTGDISWSLNNISFQPTVDQPTGITSTQAGAGSEIYRYKVTAIDSETGEESLPGIVGTTNTITGITQADPAVVTTFGSHGYSNGDEVYISNVAGMEEVNDRIFFVENVTATTFELEGIDSTNYTAYSSGGSANAAFTEVTSSVPSTSSPIVVSWTKVSGASEYNIYKESNGVYGQIGIASGTTFDDINISANTTFTPPSSRNPFIGGGNYPSTVTYIQQRLAFANTDIEPEKIFLSRTANFKNFTTSSPSQADDAITFTMAGRQVNEVQSLIDLGRLVILTTGGEWSAEGDGGVITPTTINTKQYSYNGSGDLQPIVIDGAAIYQQARGSIIRDLTYNFEISGYSGNDLTIFSAHLFDKFTIVDWSFQQIPHSILWVVRSDGALLGMTYVKSQQVIAWHRHDFGGLVENVSVVPEGNEDTLYVTVKRTINGKSVRYVEKLTSRQINDIVDNKFMDSHLSYDGRNTNTSHTMTLSGGTTWEYTETLTLTSSTSFFSANDVGNAIHYQDGEVLRLTITEYTSATEVQVKPHKTVPVTYRSQAVSEWEKAVDELAGLWHLEGKDVAIFGDGFVVASPNNASYDIVTVANGKVTLDKPYAVIHVGLPYLSDIETLDIDTPNGETISDKSKIVGEVNMFVEETRGIFVGPKPPSGTDPLENLVEFKLRNVEDYDSPVSLTTDNISVNIKPEWNSNGRVFVRQVDPIPMTILSVSPAGKFPFSG